MPWPAVRFQPRRRRRHRRRRGRDCRTPPESVAERIAQFATLVDRARALRRCVAGNSSWKRKLNEEFPKPGLILADVGIDLAVSALEVSVANHGWPAVSRS